MKRKSKRRLFDVIVILVVIMATNASPAKNITPGCHCSEKEYEDIQGEYPCFQCRDCISDRQAISELLTLDHYSSGIQRKYWCMRNSGLANISWEFYHLTNLKFLDLSHNSILSLQQNDLSNMPQLEVLHLEDNRLSILLSGSFNVNVHLRVIQLQNNLISSVELDVFSSVLKKLTYVDLSTNLLSSVDTWPLTLSTIKPIGSQHTVYIDLSYNLISEVTNKANMSIDSVREGDSGVINLRGNRLRSVQKYNIIKLLKVSFWNDLLRMQDFAVDVTNNPLSCDCDMYEFYRFSRPFLANYIKQTNRTFLNAKCASPKHLQGVLLQAVSPESFQCEAGPECPKDCSCTRIASNDTVVVVCDQWREEWLPYVLPEANTVKLYIAEGRLLSLGDRPYLSNVTTLDVGYNRIETIDPVAMRRMSRIKILVLTGNRIKYFPKDFARQTFHNLVQISLALNDFQCDCNNLWFKQWLINHSWLIEREDLVVCSDSSTRIVKLPDRKFTCYSKQYQLPLVLLIVINALVIFIITAIVVIYKYRWEARFLAYKLRWRLVGKQELQQNAADTKTVYEYDAFVCYSGDDAEWVRSALLSTIETGEHRLCLHERDFCPGSWISHNIIESMERSRCCIMILTRSFMKSEWCQFEFNMAMSHAQKRDRIVVVILEKSALLDVPKNPAMHRHIYMYRWLDPLESNFWDDLKICLKNGHALINTRQAMLPACLNNSLDPEVTIEDNKKEAQVGLLNQ